MNESVLELTPAQQDIFLEGKLFGKTLNNIGGYQVYRHGVDVDRFARARHILLNENDAYRLRFRDTGDYCQPFISVDEPADLRLVDFNEGGQAHSWIQCEFERPLDDPSSCVFEDALIRFPSGEAWYFAKAHHLIMDGWGFALQMRRLLALYAEVGAPTDTQVDRPSFVDFMYSQAGYRASSAYQASRDHWLARHSGAWGRMFMPLAHDGLAGRSERLTVDLDGALIESLRQRGREALGNLVAVMYGVLYVYFSRACQRRDIAIASPVHNRRTAQNKETIGSFVNVNVQRVLAEPDVTFDALVDQIASTQRQDYRHSRFPLGDLVRASREVAGTDGDLLYEIAFNYQKLDFQLTADGQPTETHYLSHSRERLPLTFVICDYGTAQTPRLHLDYSSDYVRGEEASAIMDRLLGLMRQVGESGARPIDDYKILTDRDWHEQFVAWQGERVPLDYLGCIHELVSAQARRTPEQVAIICGGAALTYRELDERADRLARQLLMRGVVPGSLIGICHARSLDLIVAMLAILKSGAGFVPLDPAYPRARLDYILEDAQLSTVIADAAGAELLNLPKGRVVAVDASVVDETLLGKAPVAATTDDVAYVIYTSGSTGQPKGVLIEHRNAVAFIAWSLRQFTREETSSVLAATSTCFDLSIFEIFVPLVSGGRVVLVDNVLSLVGGGVQEEISLINTVPSAIRGLLEAGAIPPSVRCINLAGELLRQDLVDALYEYGVAQVYDLYGPSESTTYSTCCLREYHGEPSIGRPINNTQAYILDEAGNPLPAGAVGELYIGGAGLARGYLNHQTMTREKFAFNQHAKARLYRTGDLVRFLGDGRLQYLGRKDGQEKIRGYRVEPGEIEARIIAHPMVADCAVIGHDVSGREGRTLAAYVVPINATTSPDDLIEQLPAFVALTLPAYMVPSAFIMLAELPLTPNGKLNRRALPPPVASDRLNAMRIASRTPVEEGLYAIWQRILPERDIGVLDSFFASGGDSLLLLKLAMSIEAEFGLRVELAPLFTHQTIEKQARWIDQEMALARVFHTLRATEQASRSSFIAL
ncbi:non-ribosomal peptide synthetase [Rhodanobacter sp. MP1X3]|uniref:non-ribosomal peptide synthetase n=1 Tax=Rhodanobacter sp. MP1X3 TaxID=2723086 RepID=UPI0016082526|nr:non-ribosomal peptide synthetase [Rhodanobacter sp. MP1X3]MBB6243704.1 amino acid adenylation domain-containing protein [Rhodanobacter sp. MP1X3]